MCPARGHCGAPCTTVVLGAHAVSARPPLASFFSPRLGSSRSRPSKASTRRGSPPCRGRTRAQLHATPRPDARSWIGASCNIEHTWLDPECTHPLPRLREPADLVRTVRGRKDVLRATGARRQAGQDPCTRAQTLRTLNVPPSRPEGRSTASQTRSSRNPSHGGRMAAAGPLSDPTRFKRRIAARPRSPSRPRSRTARTPLRTSTRTTTQRNHAFGRSD